MESGLKSRWKCGVHFRHGGPMQGAQLFNVFKDVRIGRSHRRKVPQLYSRVFRRTFFRLDALDASLVEDGAILRSPLHKVAPSVLRAHY